MHNILFAGDNKVLSLRGQWKFSLGFKNEWINSNFDDSNWDEIFAPSNWEDQGFYGYDGFACYRKKVLIPDNLKAKSLSLHLGFIDDCDEVYFNGELVGFSGSLPPNFVTAYNLERNYILPQNLIQFGKYNTITVKVYDDRLDGGIIKGDIGIFETEQPPFNIFLSGLWSFKTGDNPEYKKPDYNDSKWPKIFAPKKWESQGYPDYDGFAWYRKSVFIPAQIATEKLVIMLGKIDDLDEVYVNGVYIGQQKNLIDNDRFRTRWDELRVYYVDRSIFIPNKQNIISIRVYDNGGDGGIYEGPMGIIKQKDFVEYWRSTKH
jgi:sialate O-acetylesterase